MAQEIDKFLITNKKGIGVSGTDVTGGVYVEEYLTQLQDFRAAEIYDRMKRSDSQVRKIFGAITNPIKQAKYSIEPVSTDTIDIQVAALMEQILFKDICWTKFLHEALTFVMHGHSVFEVVHKNRSRKEFGDYTGLDELGFRRQATLVEWFHNPDTGKLEKIKQETFGDVTRNVWLPVENLLIFRNEPEGDNNGFAIARSLYGPWKRKLLALELAYIGLERFATPTPTLQVPSTVKSDSDEYREAKAHLDAFITSENAHIMYPQGWDLKLNQNETFDPTKIKEMLKFENEEMAGAILATFLELGVGGNSGAFALSNDISDFFLVVIENFPLQLENTINTELIPNLVRLNFGDTVDKMPELKHSGISDKAGEETMKIITGYVKNGVITNDEPLEDHVRKVHSLPKKAEGTIIDNQETGGKSGANVERNNDGDSNDDLNNDNGGDQSPNEARALKLQETKPKNAKQLIDVEAKIIEDVMKKNITFITDKYIADGIKAYKQLSESSKLRAFDKVKIGGKAKYKKELKAALVSASNKALEMVKKEVPGHENIKLSDYPFTVPKGYETFKFNEFSKLPKHVQLLLSRQVDELTQKTVNESTQRVTFQFQSTESSTLDPNLIKQDLDNVASTYVEGGTLPRAAANTVATIINDTRNSFMFADDVIEEIKSFTFVNDSPKAAICVKLAGKTFATNDAEFARFQPPLHHNCKSFLSANLVAEKQTPEITGLPTITETERNSITLSELAKEHFKK